MKFILVINRADSWIPLRFTVKFYMISILQKKVASRTNICLFDGYFFFFWQGKGEPGFDGYFMGSSIVRINSCRWSLNLKGSLAYISIHAYHLAYPSWCRLQLCLTTLLFLPFLQLNAVFCNNHANHPSVMSLLVHCQ